MRSPSLPRSGWRALAAVCLGMLLACGGSSSGKKPRARVLEPKGTVPFSGTGDIWAEGPIIYVAGRASGSVYVVDASDPDLPVQIHEITGLVYPQDVKVQDGILYATNEAQIIGQTPVVGCWIFDVSDPTNALYLGQVDSPGLEACHNAYVDGDHLYLASDVTGQVHIVDVSNPAAPVDVARIPPQSGSIHDMVTIDGVCYAAFLSGGFAVADVSVPSVPGATTYHDYPNSLTHNIWPTEDGRYVLTTDENTGGHVKIWDIRDLGNIQEVATYSANPVNTVHNVHVRGRYAYVAAYKDGLHIVDISDPTSPVLAGSFDTYSGADGPGFNGAWGVYPFHPPWVYVSDISSGLFVFRF